MKPCPFCGGTDIEFTCGEDSDLWAHCEDCHAGVSGGETNSTPDGETEDINGLNDEDRKQCREAWNIRHSSTEAEDLAKVMLEDLKRFEVALRVIQQTHVMGSAEFMTASNALCYRERLEHERQQREGT